MCNGTLGICACLLQGRVSQWKTASGWHQPGLDKASACVVFVCNELCLILHNLCSGGHVTKRETEGEREMKTKLKEDKEYLSFAAFPVLFPSEYFVNKLNPAPDNKLLDVMWICF